MNAQEIADALSQDSLDAYIADAKANGLDVEVLPCTVPGVHLHLTFTSPTIPTNVEVILSDMGIQTRTIQPLPVRPMGVLH